MMSMKEQLGGLADNMTLTLVKNGLEKFVTFPKSPQYKEATELLERAQGIEAIAYADNLFPRIDPGFLSMKHKEKLKGSLYDYDLYKRDIHFNVDLPRFGVYTLDSPVCQLELTLGVIIGGRYDKRSKIIDIGNPMKLPNVLFWELTKPIGSINKNREGVWDEEYTLFSLFNGLIPKSVKKKVETCEKIFGDKIYVVAEAENWQAKAVPIKDPLVIGVIHDRCYLLDQFDCTHIEHYTKSEFST